MDSNSKQLATIITKKILKRKNKYQDVYEILSGDEDEDKYIDSIHDRGHYASISSSNTDKEIDCILNEIYKVDPDLENDNSILWDILWFFGYQQSFVGKFINYLKRKSITNRELARAFGNEEDTPFQIVREFIGPQILKEFTDEIRKSKMENIDTIKYRSRIIRLLLHKINFSIGFRNYSNFSEFLNINFRIKINCFDYFDYTLINQFDIQFEPKIYKINQWDFKITEVIDILSDIFLQIKHKDIISLKSMEFPFSPFYSVCVEALLNFETPQNIKTTLETLKNKTIKDTTTRMEIVQEGIVSIREGERPLELLWKIGRKHGHLKESLNKMYNYPLFSKDVDTKEWWTEDVEKKIYKTIRNRKELKAVKEVNFWTLPLENIVDIVMQLSIKARNGGLLVLDFNMPIKALQTEIQSTYKFLDYGIKMATNAVPTDEIVYEMNFNTSLIIQNLSNHLALVIYWVCKFNQHFDLYPKSLLVDLYPESLLGHWSKNMY